VCNVLDARRLTLLLVMNTNEQKFVDWAEEQLQDIVDVVQEDYGDQSKVFKLHTTKGNYFLKIGSELEKEYERLQWLWGKLPVPKVVGFTKIEDTDGLLLSAIEGKNLAVLSKEWPPEKVVDKLVGALQKFHALDVKSCPFGNFEESKVLVHGDACLPNFIFQGDDFSGYVDLGNMVLGSLGVDFSAAIWSLQYNLGVGYGGMFLKKYGVEDVTDELVEKLRLQYEDMQKEWGL
jgi:aminoglycoside 3'-phosphotransferase II